MIANLFLGCPIWGNKTWVGELFSSDARAADFLRQYASVFNTVEGNTTFYGMPTESTVARWRADTPPGFRFCFKFPRAISHDRRLVGAQGETEFFLNLLAPLEERLGPFFLQLPPSFALDDLPVLDDFLAGLSHDFRYAVEVRHPSFFDGGEGEARLDGLLASLGVDRVLMDVRGLRASPGDDPESREALRKKPNVPHRTVATSSFPLVRYIANSDIPANEPLLAEWADTVAAWRAEGRTPFFFCHAPDDFYAPRLARRFHQLLSQRLPVGSLPTWPAERDPPPNEQLSLF